jgi:FMN reductase
VLLGGAQNHRLAVDVHFTPLLAELGAAVPVRGLFVLETEVPGFGAFAAGWAGAHAPALLAATGATVFAPPPEPAPDPGPALPAEPAPAV